MRGLDTIKTQPNTTYGLQVRSLGSRGSKEDYPRRTALPYDRPHPDVCRPLKHVPT